MPGPVHPLHVGDTHLEPPPAALEQMRASATQVGQHRYAPVQGIEPLLEQIEAALAERGGVPVERDCMQVTAGATSGLSVVAGALWAPGDEVLLPSPFWPLIRGIIQSRGARAVQVPLWTRVSEPGFDVAAALEPHITRRTVALYLNSPHNPTGHILPAGQLDALADLAEAHNLWVICDEAYEHLWYGAEAPTPIWAHPRLRARAIACHTLSKSFAMAGARIGYVHGPAAAMQVIRGVQTFQTYCAAQPMQWLAAHALATRGTWLPALRQRNRQAGTLAATALGAEAPEGGTFLFVDARPALRPGESDCEALLHRALDAGVMLTPGAACGTDFGGWVRLCFTSVPEPALQDAMQRLEPVLAPHR